MILSKDYLPYPEWLPHLVSIFVFGGMAAILIWFNLKKREFHTKGIPVRGHVLNHVWTEPDSKGKTKKIVEMGFETLDGKNIIGQPSFNTFGGKLHPVGSVLLVKYMPDDPQKFILSDSLSIYRSVSTNMFFVIILFFLFAGNYIPLWMPIATSVFAVYRIADWFVRRNRERKYLD